MYLVDTNVISEIRKVEAGKADPKVVAWTRNTDSEITFLSAITVQELETGTLRLARRDPAAGTVLRHWLEDRVYRTFEQRILPVGARVARIAARFHVPDPAPFGDALIAATAFVHDMTVVTRNVRDFLRFEGVRILNPWERGDTR